jgi:hypothetical protein
MLYISSVTKVYNKRVYYYDIHERVNFRGCVMYFLAQYIHVKSSNHKRKGGNYFWINNISSNLFIGVASAGNWLCFRHY